MHPKLTKATKSSEEGTTKALDKQRKLFEYTYAISLLTESRHFMSSVVSVVWHLVTQGRRVIVITMRKENDVMPLQQAD